MGGDDKAIGRIEGILEGIQSDIRDIKDGKMVLCTMHANELTQMHGNIKDIERRMSRGLRDDTDQHRAGAEIDLPFGSGIKNVPPRYLVAIVTVLCIFGLLGYSLYYSNAKTTQARDEFRNNIQALVKMMREKQGTTP